MPSFLARLFRRKKHSCLGSKYVGQNEEVTPERRPKRGKKGDIQPAPRVQKMNSTSKNQVGDSNSSRGGSKTSKSDKKKKSRVLTPRNDIPATTVPTSSKPISKLKTSRPIDLDDSVFDEYDQDENHDRSNFNDPGLSFQRLEQFNMQDEQVQPSQALYGWKENTAPSNYASQRPDVIDKSLVDDQSASSASEFNLSTDAEDEEYNNIKLRLAGHAVANQIESTALNNIGLDTSGLSSNNTTDDENAIFPALHTDDEKPRTVNNPQNVSTPVGEPGAIRKSTEKRKNNDSRAWGFSPSAGSSGRENNLSPRFTTSKKSPVNGNQRETKDRSKENLTPAANDGFADFANFETFDANFESAFPAIAVVPAAAPSSKRGRSHSSSHRKRTDGGDEPIHNYRPSNGVNGHRDPSSIMLSLRTPH